MDLTPQELADLPPAVRAQYDEGEKLEEAALKEPPPEPSPEPNPEPDGGYKSLLELAKEDPPEPAPQEVPPEVLAKGTPEPGKTPAPSGETIPKTEYDKLMARFTTLQGKYNAEVPTLSQQISELRNELRNISEQSRKTTPEIPAHQRLLNASEREDYEDMNDALGVSGKAALGISQAEQERLKAEFDARMHKIEEQQQALAAREAQQRLFAEVDKLCPGASSINQMPQFDQFLNTVDPVTGRTYKVLGEAAANIGDIQRVADIVTVFKTQAGMEIQAPPQPIKPEVSTSGPPPTTQAEKGNKPILKASDIEAFYRDQIKGKYGEMPQDHPEVKKIQAIIDDAERENRIDIAA